METVASRPTLESVVACPNLPTLPGVAVELLRMTRDGDPPIAEIAACIANDPALTSKILRTVNSSYYGLSVPCSTISRALGYLGLNTVKSLVLGFSLVDSFDEQECADFDFRQYWRRIVHAATAARLTAQRIGQVDPEEAFIAALLQDVGMLAMSIVLEDAYADIVGDVADDPARLIQLERERLGFDHTEAGAALADRWALPEALVEAIRHHHDHDIDGDSAEASTDLVRMIWLANLATRVLIDPSETPLVPFIEQAQKWFAFCPNQTETLLGDIADAAREMSKFLHIAPGSKPDVARILTEAQEELLRHQISLEREAQQLRGDRDAMASKAYVDGLTGLANRRRFDELIESSFADARAGDEPLAVAFIDVDEFKQLNDTCGHQVGDRILVDLARRLSDVVGEAGYVCRYGGEEIVSILPRHDRCAAARIAEAMRKVVEMSPFDVSAIQSEPPELPVRISIGVAAFNGADFERYGRAACLVQLADKAVYAAKRSGRNCVRVANLGAPRSTPPHATPNGAPATAKNAAQCSAPAAPPQDEAAAPNPPQCQAGTVRATSPAGPRDRTGSSIESRRLTALLIEDDNLHARLVSTLLHAAPNVAVHHVATADAALRTLRAAPSSQEMSYAPDLILCDLRLPDTPGDRLIEAIRAIPRHATTPIVVLSASESREDVARCLSAGANAYVPKRRLADDPKACITQIAAFWRMTERAD